MRADFKKSLDHSRNAANIKWLFRINFRGTNTLKHSFPLISLCGSYWPNTKKPGGKKKSGEDRLVNLEGPIQHIWQEITDTCAQIPLLVISLLLYYYAEPKVFVCLLAIIPGLCWRKKTSLSSPYRFIKTIWNFPSSLGISIVAHIFLRKKQYLKHFHFGFLLHSM